MSLTNNNNNTKLHFLVICLSGLIIAFSLYHFKRELFSKNIITNQISLVISPQYLKKQRELIPLISDGCLKKNYPWLPIESIKINNKKLKGSYLFRFKGYCSAHWGYRQKSIKIKKTNGERLFGKERININTFNSDPGLFDLWASRLYQDLGGHAPQSKIISLEINNHNKGLSLLVENLDENFLKDRELKKGEIYRERSRSLLGLNLNNLKEYWKKNSAKKVPWQHWIRFNQEIQNSVLDKGHSYLKYLEKESYLLFHGFIAIIGSNHFLDHNIAFYRDKKKPVFTVIGFDFFKPNLSKHNHLFSAINYPLVGTHHLSKMFLASSKHRLKCYQLMAKILKLPSAIEDNYRQLIEQYAPAIFSDAQSKKILNAFPKPKTVKEYINKITPLNQLTKRVSYLREKILNPIILLGDRQHLIDAIGPIKIKVDKKNVNCESPIAKIKMQGEIWRDLYRCENGVVKRNTIIIERNRIVAPTKMSEYLDIKNPIGPILFQTKPLTIAKYLKFKSLVTNEKIRVNKQRWPFHIVIKNKSLDLGATKKSKLKEIKAHSLERQEGYALIQSNDGYLKIHRKKDYLVFSPLPLSKQKWSSYGDPYRAAPGAFLCWNIAKRKNCLEFDRDYMLHHKLLRKSDFPSLI